MRRKAKKTEGQVTQQHRKDKVATISKCGNQITINAEWKYYQQYKYHTVEKAL